MNERAFARVARPSRVRVMSSVTRVFAGASPAAPSAAGHVSWRLSPLLLLLAGCVGDLVELGTDDARPVFGDSGQSVRNLNRERNEEYDPTLTDDLLEIFFISDRADGVGNKDVWHAERRDRSDPFGLPTVVEAASSPFEEASVAVSGDGLTLWVGSRRTGGLGGIDIWRTRRSERRASWQPLEPAVALNSEFDDLPRPPGERGSVLPIASNRSTAPAVFQTFFATRPGPQQDFMTPEPVDELWDASASIEDGFLSDDGLHLFFRRAVPGQNGDLFVAWRSASDAPFEPPVVLEGVNGDYDERDPFISADRSRFFFASNRHNGNWLDIYATRLNLPTYR